MNTCGLHVSVTSTFSLAMQFAVSEEDLWHAVLLWAKRNSSVNKPTHQWTEEDNNKIREVKKIIKISGLLLMDNGRYKKKRPPGCTH